MKFEGDHAFLNDVSWQKRLSLAKQLGSPATIKSDADLFLAEQCTPAAIQNVLAEKSPDGSERSTPQQMADVEAMQAIGIAGMGAPGGVDMGYMPDPSEDLPRGGIKQGHPLDPVEYKDPREDARPNPEGFTPYEVNDADLKELVEKYRDGLKVESWWPRVICMKYGKPGKVTHALFGWAAGGQQRIDFMPFQRSAPLHPKLFQNINKQVQSRKHGTYLKRLWAEPPRDMVDMRTGLPLEPRQNGDCKREMTWHDTISGLDIATCLYQNCPHHPLPKHLWHSIWMAQNFVATLMTDSTIRGYVKNFDPRPEVGHFATLVIDQRQAKLMEGTGHGADVNENLVY